MRSLPVVLVDERIEPRLLLQHVRRRLRRFLLQREVHPLVPAVLAVSPGGAVWLIEDSANGGVFRVMPRSLSVGCSIVRPCLGHRKCVELVDNPTQVVRAIGLGSEQQGIAACKRLHVRGQIA